MSTGTNWIRRTSLTLVILGILIAGMAWGGDRFPDEQWMHYQDVSEAGFDAAKLKAARETWESLPSSAFLVIADGAVVASWGQVERRFMCHSVRKSFLSALYGIYWDQGKIELNKTMADLGIDDEPDPLLEIEKQARILDLLKARSGVFHPAAYAGRTDSQPRGSQGPGRYFAYNNWDFNTLATILEQETGDQVFEAFDQHFAKPLGMQDWRLSDGYFHYERDKSKYPAYPFRMSARDAARFGLLFARNGRWKDQQILSRHWVNRSSALYSIDSDIMGYGFMWWVFREPRFARYGMYSALGVGNQMIAVLPEIGLVIVNRADTFQGESTPTAALLELVEQVLEARSGAPAANPQLVPLEERADPKLTRVAESNLQEFVGEWEFPAPPLGLPSQTRLQLQAGDGHLVSYLPFAGTYRLYLQPDGSLHQEDSHRRYVVVRNTSGAFAGIADGAAVARGAVSAASEGNDSRARDLLRRIEGDDSFAVGLAKALVDLLSAGTGGSDQQIRELARKHPPARVEALVNAAGYELLQQNKAEQALKVFELNTRVFPEAFNTWDSLGEAHMVLGNDEEAIRFYQKSLELNRNNGNAERMIAKIREGAGSPR